jgi:hypothetical protein
MDKEYDELISNLKEKYKIEEYVLFDDINIQEKLRENAYMILHYKGLYFKEKNNLDKISEIRDKIIGKRFDYYRFNYNKELKSNEIKEYYLPQDEEITKINRLYKKQQWKVDFFEAATEALIQMGWRMKSYLDERRT